MFILYDLNMKQIPFPDGIVPLDIFVSSIAKERQTETIPGRVGVADYGSEYRERSVDLSLMIKSYNAMFYRTQRNRLYELFSEHDVFYIAESHLPSRVLKVAVDDSYIPERIPGNAYASTAEITCRTLDSVFWESIYTTKELHDTGYDAAVAKYGLVDNIDTNQTQYEFTTSEFSIWNAGNVTIEPEFMYLIIRLNYAYGANGVSIKNLTTGESFILNTAVSGSHVVLNGMDIRRGALNALRESNRQRIRLLPGKNDFEIVADSFDIARVETRFYYK